MKDPIIETLERLHLALERTREEYENGFSLIALRLRKKTVLNAMSILRNFINNVGINVKFLSFNPLTKKIEFVYSSRNEILNCSNYCINISKNNIDALKKLDDALWSMFHNKYGYSIFLFDSKQEDMEKAIIPLATIIKILKRFKETMLKTVVLSNCKKYS